MTGPTLVLVVNAGSSSLKYQLVEPESGRTTATGLIERVTDHRAALEKALSDLAATGHVLDAAHLLAIGHRVVHGGSRFSEPVVIDERVRTAIAELATLAPLHNPANLYAIEATTAAFPGIAQVAVFDTAFHQTIPPDAHTYAVPTAWRHDYHVRRYGFHGTSIAYVSRRVADLLGLPPEDVNLVVLHLGNGCSACAVRGGRSVETSMGLSPLEGLVMGTRSGDVDPALGAYLSRAAGVDSAAYDLALNTASGLLGLAGVSDFREVTSRRATGDEAAGLAFDVVVHRLVKYVGAYAAVLGRVDAIVFTGGIGEHSAELREAVLGRLGVLGVELDARANVAARGESCVTTGASRVSGWVVPTNEELEIARACVKLLG
ncbi:MAG: acetate kinase [Nostocoides sp.]